MKRGKTHEPYAVLVAKYGRTEAKRQALEAIRRSHPPKREVIDLSNVKAKP